MPPSWLESLSSPTANWIFRQVITILPNNNNHAGAAARNETARAALPPSEPERFGESLHAPSTTLPALPGCLVFWADPARQITCRYCGATWEDARDVWPDVISAH